MENDIIFFGNIFLFNYYHAATHRHNVTISNYWKVLGTPKIIQKTPVQCALCSVHPYMETAEASDNVRRA